jgi:hypothetical protein
MITKLSNLLQTVSKLPLKHLGCDWFAASGATRPVGCSIRVIGFLNQTQSLASDMQKPSSRLHAGIRK